MTLRLPTYVAPALLIGLFLAASSCKAPEESAAEAELYAEEPPAEGIGGILVMDARVQRSPHSAALYLVIVNAGETADRLLEIEAAGAGTHLHETVEEEGVMRMVPHPDGFAVPAGGSVELAPGGKHAMLMGLELAEGATHLPVTLHFEEAGAVTVEAAVVSPAAMVTATEQE